MGRCYVSTPFTHHIPTDTTQHGLFSYIQLYRHICGSRRLYPFVQIQLPPTLAASAMALSSFFVVINPFGTLDIIIIIGINSSIHIMIVIVSSHSIIMLYFIQYSNADQTLWTKHAIHSRTLPYPLLPCVLLLLL